MRSIRLLLKNSFRSARRNLAQIVGLSALVMIVSLVASLLSATSTRVVTAYEELKIQSNQRDAIMEHNMNARITGIDNEQLSDNQELLEQYVMNQLALKYNFEWTRTEARMLSGLLTPDGDDLKIKAVIKFNSKNTGIDQLVVSKGRMFEKGKNEVVISESFAKRNNIQIGDIIRVQTDTYGKSLLVKENNEVASEIENKNIDEILQMGKYQNMLWFEVVGFGSSADYATPLIDETSIIADTSREVFIYMDKYFFGYEGKVRTEVVVPDSTKKDTREMYTYDVSKSNIMVTSEYDREISFSMKFNNEYNKKILDEIQKDYGIFANVSSSEKQFYDLYDTDYKFTSRVTTFDMVIKAYNAMSAILMAVILIIASFTIVLITKKQVEAQSKQIGTLKALGYRKREVVNNFAAVPLLVSIIGSIVGYTLSIFIATFVVKGFTVYFNVAFYGFDFDLFGFLGGIIFVWILLTVISFSVGYWVIRTTALNLLKGGDDKAINKFGVGIKKMYAKTSFDTRLRASLLTTSIGKLAGVSATMLLGTTLLTTTVIAPKVMKDNMEATFRGMNYENVTEYTQPLANNPLSFYKTYNPEFNEWRYDEENPVDTIYDGSGTTTPSYVPFPVDKDGNPDLNSIFNAIIEGNISNEFWSYEIALNNKYAWSKMSYLNWKNLSIDFLKLIDNVEVGGIGADDAIKQIQDQWPDYNTFTTKLSKESNFNNIQEFTQELLWFYNKYTNGLDTTFNKKYVTNFELINGNDLVADIKGYTPFWGGSRPKHWLFEDYWNTKKFDNIANSTSWFKPIKTSKTTEMEINYKGEIISISQLPSSIYEDEEFLKELNTVLIAWFGTVVNNRISLALVQTTYSRSPYFLQELIKDAWNNNKTYNISFNTVPYIPEKDEIGTMLSANYNLKGSNKKESFNIYGVNPDTKLVELNNSKNKNLLPEIFKEQENDKIIPIIINETVAKKTGVGINQNLNLEISSDILADENNNKLTLEEDINLGFDSNYERYIHQGSKTYYSTDGKGFADTSGPYPAKFTPGYFGENTFGVQDDKININKGNKFYDKNFVTNKYAQAVNIFGTPQPIPGAVDETTIHQAYSNGTLKIITKLVSEGYEFRVVGIQDGYGQPQGWIDNNIANKLMGYNETKKFNFENWFLKEYSALDSLYTDEIFKDASRLEDLKNFMHEAQINSKNSYSKFMEKVHLAESNNDAFVKMNTYFENLYPIFNYKYSSTPSVTDLQYGFSTSQRLGDFSSQGLNGNYTYITDPNCNPEDLEEGEVCGTIPDTSNFVEGYGIGSLKTMMPMEQTRQILGQITDIVNMIIIMFIVIALLVSSTIILLATSLVIYENKQFIATMKTLGYSNGYIVRQILGIYVLAILIMFAFGIGIGWMLFKYTATYLALNTAWVLPVTFGWWIPFAVFAILAAIYILTFITSWNAVLKINPVESLKVKD